MQFALVRFPFEKCLAILRGVGVRVVVCGVYLWGAGCEMLSLILELQTCQLGFCIAHVSRFIDTKMSFSRFVALYFAN